ncbi:MAG: radical SAM protein [Candidatus Methanofastidiosum sp.]|nr:radical SAM protein [Methanofastidiosum sp.]
MKDFFKPVYLSMSKEDFEFKLNKSIGILSKCNLCPRKCNVNRCEGELGVCNSGINLRISSYGPHYGEEKELVGKYGSGTIFFTNCNLKCIFCQNYDISHLGQGYEVTNEQLSKIMLYLQNKGCHNINLVTPTHFMPQILQSVYLAIKDGLKIPLVYNCGGYESLDSIKILEGIIDIYMPDFKFGDNKSALKYIGVKDYFNRAKEAIKEMHKQVGDLKLDNDRIARSGLIIRHLVMPNNSSNSEKVIEFISNEISKKSYFNLMEQYRPCYKAIDYPEINRKLKRQEYLDCLKIAKRLINY